jgi:RHS repeat-associated protein
MATRAGVATRYIYDPWGNLVAEVDSSNNIVRKYVYGKGLLAMATSSGRYCYHFDGTGSTVAITDMIGTVVNSYAYDPFGAIVNQQETVPQPFKYVGQHGVMAEPNGLYYMRARYYDPGVGRFVSEDPLGFGGGDVNLYAYVMSNPITFIDPEGLSPVGWIIKLTGKGFKKVCALGSKSAASEARKRGENVLAKSRQMAKAIEEAASGGTQDVLRHSGHELPNGSKGMPHFQTPGKPGHTFWGAAVLGGLLELLDPFDAVSGELTGDDMINSSECDDPCGGQ